jgi:glycosyltransferase involved in cell wall biosynthesis
MNAVPRLSIGLPVYNGEKHLAECLDALLGQSYEDFELIISDNASTDSTADICRHFMKQDRRIRYIRQSRNIGRVPNHNFLIGQARGELFKWVACDDLYAKELLTRCVDALDEHPHLVLAHAWSVIIDASRAVTAVVKYPVFSDSVRAPDRFRSMLFDGWGDDSYGVVRTAVLRRTPLHGSYHFADRTFTTEIALHGPFYQVPEFLFFRRDAPKQPGPVTVRMRCATMDPRRESRLRHPVVRLYAEYCWAYISMIQRAPLSPAERRECYRHLARWAASRATPVVDRVLHRRPLYAPDLAAAGGSALAGRQPLVISVDALVAGREREPSWRHADSSLARDSTAWAPGAGRAGHRPRVPPDCRAAFRRGTGRPLSGKNVARSGTCWWVTCGNSSAPWTTSPSPSSPGTNPTDKLIEALGFERRGFRPDQQESSRGQRLPRLTG